MKEYKHLNACIKKKIEFWNVLKSKVKSNVVLLTVIVVIICIFMIGFLAFYNLIDSFDSESHVSDVYANNLNSENNPKEDFSEQEKMNLKPITDFAEKVDNLPSQSKKISDESNIKKHDDKCSEKNVSKESDFENTNSENENMDSKNKYDFSSWNRNCSYEQMVINKYNAIPDDIIVNTKVCRGKEVYIEELDKHITVKGITNDYWDFVYNKRMSDESLTKEEFRWYENRKANRGTINGTLFDILATRDYDEIEGEWGDTIYEPLGTAQIECDIVSALGAFDNPSSYTIENLEIVDGVDVPISEVVSFTHTYAGEVIDGEHAIAKGKVEKVITNGKDHHYRLVVGTTREAIDEYLKLKELPQQ